MIAWPSSHFLSDLGVIEWGHTSQMQAESFNRFTTWIGQRQHAGMKYLEGDRAKKRENLKSIYPEAKSALVFLFGYRQVKTLISQIEKKDGPKIAGYVFGFEGHDYHIVLKTRLETIGKHLQVLHPGLEWKIALDTSPVLERDLAYRAGLGWFGKNSMLINRHHGSYFIIGSLLINQDLSLPDLPKSIDHCGHCNLCAQSCPTEAIDVQTRTVHSEKCISYYTIEMFKDAPPLSGHSNARGEIFGCDICQEVCPWVKKNQIKESSCTDQIEKGPLLDLIQNTPEQSYQQIKKLSLTQFKKLFAATPLGRTGKAGLLKNFRSSFPRLL